MVGTLNQQLPNKDGGMMAAASISVLEGNPVQSTHKRETSFYAQKSLKFERSIGLAFLSGWKTGPRCGENFYLLALHLT